jgi:hypothetical protein
MVFLIYICRMSDTVIVNRHLIAKLTEMRNFVIKLESSIARGNLLFNLSNDIVALETENQSLGFYEDE